MRYLLLTLNYLTARNAAPIAGKFFSQRTVPNQPFQSQPNILARDIASHNFTQTANRFFEARVPSEHGEDLSSYYL